MLEEIEIVDKRTCTLHKGYYAVNQFIVLKGFISIQTVSVGAVDEEG